MKTISSHQQQDDLLQLSSSLSKMLKRKLGKGPETCFLTLHSERLIVYVRNFMTPAEEVLIKDRKIGLAYRFRSAVMEHVCKDFTEEVEKILGITYDSFSYDWDYDTNKGIMLLEHKADKQWATSDIDPSIKGKLFEKIMHVSSSAHRIPHSIEIIKVNQNLLAISCQGVILKVENILVKKGYLDILHERSSEIKKTYLKEKELFENIIKRKIDGLFITWDYIHDRCHIFFYVN